MIGIRTPTKRATTVNPPNRSPHKTLEEAKTSTQPNVRRSVGEWEAGTVENRKLATPPKTSSPISARGAPVLLIDSPPAPVSNIRNPRIAEAKRCLIKVKHQMSLSRNIKREIKEDVTSQVERLFALIKEAEADAGRVPSAGTNRTTEARNSVVPTTSSTCIAQDREGGSAKESETESLKKALEEHSRKLAENNEKMDKLKEALRTNQDKIEKISYASAVTTQQAKLPPRQTALHSIAVTTEDEKSTGEEVLTKIRQAVDAKEGWIKVERVRKTKNRKVIMSFGSKEEKEKAKERLKKGNDLTVEDVKNRDPLLILRDVLTVNTDEDVLKAFRNQNPDVFCDLEGEADRMTIKYRKRARNPHTGHIIITTSPTIWQRATTKGHVYIDLQRIRVEDQSPLIQCSLCLGYGHSRRLCTETLEKCSHCGGPHMKNKCADWLSGTAPTCCNCSHAKLEKTDHNAFSTDCAIRQRWDSIVRSAIAYC